MVYNFFALQHKYNLRAFDNHCHVRIITRIQDTLKDILNRYLLILVDAHLDFGLHSFNFALSISIDSHLVIIIRSTATHIHSHVTVDCSTWRFWFVALVCNNCAYSLCILLISTISLLFRYYFVTISLLFRYYLLRYTGYRWCCKY